MVHLQLIFTVACLTCLVTFGLSNANVVQDVDVLILGAGVSGISVAESLHEAGIKNFLVLEAQDYIGGRIKHVPFAGYLAPLGAGWIHSIGRNNPMWILSQKHNLKVHYDNYDDVIIRNINNGRTTHSIHSLKQQFMKAVHKSNQYISKRLRKGHTDVPFKASLAMHDWVANTPEMKATEYFFSDFENGISTKTTSANVYGLTGQAKDVIVTDPRGYTHILEKMADPFRNKVLFHKVVKEVSRMGGSYLVKVQGEGYYKANYVMVTFSSGVLQSGMVTFTPKLPDWKTKAISMVPMCHYCKVFMRFPRKFWEDKNYILLGNDAHGKFVHWQNFEKPTLFAGKNVFLVTVTEDRCEELQHKTDDEVTAEAMAILKKAYGNHIPNPIEILRNNWSQNPFAKGSYPNPVVGINAYDWKSLEEPVGKNLWFSGDYNAGPDEYGYTHGAYLAGKRQANRLIKCINKEDCPNFNGILQPRCRKIQDEEEMHEKL